MTSPGDVKAVRSGISDEVVPSSFASKYYLVRNLILLREGGYSSRRQKGRKH